MKMPHVDEEESRTGPQASPPYSTPVRYPPSSHSPAPPAPPFKRYPAPPYYNCFGKPNGEAEMDLYHRAAQRHPHPPAGPYRYAPYPSWNGHTRPPYGRQLFPARPHHPAFQDPRRSPTQANTPSSSPASPRPPPYDYSSLSYDANDDFTMYYGEDSGYHRQYTGHYCAPYDEGAGRPSVPCTPSSSFRISYGPPPGSYEAGRGGRGGYSYYHTDPDPRFIPPPPSPVTAPSTPVLNASSSSPPPTYVTPRGAEDTGDAYHRASPPHLEPVASIDEVRENDVLCGRGAPTNYHPGNAYFRDLVKSYQSTYLASKRVDKPFIANHIVQVIQSHGGRFLRRYKRNGVSWERGHFVWVEIGPQRAYEKACQALREGAPELRRKQGAVAMSMSEDPEMDTDECHQQEEGADDLKENKKEGPAGSTRAKQPAYEQESSSCTDERMANDGDSKPSAVTKEARGGPLSSGSVHDKAEEDRNGDDEMNRGF